MAIYRDKKKIGEIKGEEITEMKVVETIAGEAN
jgi:hypothetical protein